MKRYRVLPRDFDLRVRTLADPINPDWDEMVKEAHYSNRKKAEQDLAEQYGIAAFEQKKKNFIDLDAKPFSILAFHNEFFEQARTSFIMGAYYPALTAACALGERILNHLVLILRDEYKSSDQYKRIYDKDSFDDWKLAIDTLLAWDVILPKVGEMYFELMEKRNKAIHFRPEVDINDRELALAAIQCLQKIIGSQFSAFGNEPWFVADLYCEMYIKKEWENHPFIRKIYLPSCAYVGPRHMVESVSPWHISDCVYEDRDITDQEFLKLRKEALQIHPS